MRPPLGQLKLNYATGMSIVALVLGAGGTAYAAKTFTAVNVKNGALTGRQVKDGSITAANISSKFPSQIHGPAGPSGGNGPRGATGPDGATGAQGPRGDDSYALTRWASYDTNVVRSSSSATPNAGGLAWDDPTYAGGRQLPLSGQDVIDMDGTERPVVALSGISAGQGTYSSTGTMNTSGPPSFQSNLSGTVSLTFLHLRANENTDYSAGATTRTFHGRLNCRLVYGNGGALTGSSSQMGAPEWVTSSASHELVTVTIAANASNVSAGNYNVGALCGDADYNGTTQWRFVSGNLTALAAQQ